MFLQKLVFLKLIFYMNYYKYFINKIILKNLTSWNHYQQD